MLESSPESFARVAADALGAEAAFACARCKLPFVTRQMLVTHDVVLHGLAPAAAAQEVAEFYGPVQTARVTK